MLNKGILLIAIGNPYYGRMAYNLAISIKAIDKQCPITLVYTHSAIAHINNKNLWVFDKLVFYNDNNNGFAAKLQLYDYSPYEQTLYIDVDALWVNKMSPLALIDKLKGVPFTGITEGFHDYENPAASEHSKYYFFWADLDEIKNTYNVNKKIYQWRSEFIYFEKCDLVNELFASMKSLYNENILKTVKKFAGHIPDELAFNIGTSILNIEPHTYKWKPSFWDRINNNSCPSIEELNSNYYIISCGSNYNTGALKKIYDRVTKACCYKLGLQHVFPLINKKELINERQLM